MSPNVTPLNATFALSLLEHGKNMTPKEQKIAAFDPSGPGHPDAGIYGLPFTAEESDIIILPVPWEVTVSYGAGASDGPMAILEASRQVDLHHPGFPDLWKRGIFMDRIPAPLKAASDGLKKMAGPIIEAMESGMDITGAPKLREDMDTINRLCEAMNTVVRARAEKWMGEGKKTVLLGGDHSTPLGYYQALATRYADFGILHLDAHMDLRPAYEGFVHSHASIMYNAIQLPQVSKLVQVGVRDFCEQEAKLAQSSGKVAVFTDPDLKKGLFEGQTWKQMTDKIIHSLPENVTISFDVDALQRWYCPNTGTPVPGGLSYEQATYLLDRLADSGKNIIGADLVEVAPGENSEWDGNVGARLLYHLCGTIGH